MHRATSGLLDPSSPSPPQPPTIHPFRTKCSIFLHKHPFPLKTSQIFNKSSSLARSLSTSTSGMEKLKHPLTFSPPLNLHPKPSPLRKFLCCSQFSSQESNPKPPESASTKISSLLWSIPDWADAVQERGMRKNRTLYTADDWRAHRSSRRHLRHFLSSLSSRVILSLVPPVLSFTSFAALIALYNSAVLAGWLPEFLPVLKASSLPYQLTAPALALLLVFRTEASYARYVEGRNCWMRVMAGTSELATLVMGIKGRYDNDDERIRRAALAYIMAFPVALKVSSCLPRWVSNSKSPVISIDFRNMYTSLMNITSENQEKIPKHYIFPSKRGKNQLGNKTVPKYREAYSTTASMSPPFPSFACCYCLNYL